MDRDFGERSFGFGGRVPAFVESRPGFGFVGWLVGTEGRDWFVGLRSQEARREEGPGEGEGGVDG